MKPILAFLFYFGDESKRKAHLQQRNENISPPCLILLEVKIMLVMVACFLCVCNVFQ